MYETEPATAFYQRFLQSFRLTNETLSESVGRGGFTNLYRKTSKGMKNVMVDFGSRKHLSKRAEAYFSHIIHKNYLH
jgi:hypothetical protein